MARIRLFAGLRELVGASSIETDASTVAEAIGELTDLHGDELAAALDRVRIWVNGEPVDGPDAPTPVGADDEIAIIPPVSGGATPVVSGLSMQVALVGIVAVALLLAAAFGSPAVLGAVLVAVAALWAWDVSVEATAIDVRVHLAPVFIAILVAPVALRWLTGDAFGLAAAASVIAPLVWMVVLPEARDLVDLAVSVLVAALGAMAVAGLAEVGARDRTVATVAVVVVAVPAVAAWVAERYQLGGMLDPFTAAALTVLVAGTVAGGVTDIGLIVGLLSAVGAGLGFVGGRALGTLMRTGDVTLLERPPGALAALDGPALALLMFLVVHRLVA